MTTNVNEKWLRPMNVDKMDVAFGPKGGRIEDYLPKWKELPEDFRNERGEAKKWVHIIDEFFFYGATQIRCEIKDPSVSQSDILRHINMLLNSFELSHEHKTSGVAYLLSLWCTDVTYELRPPRDPQIT